MHTGSRAATPSSAGHRENSRAAQEFAAEGQDVPLTSVYRAFAGTRAGTKYGIATALVPAFPELMVGLPPKRKPWQTEDSRMSIFDAVALGLAYPCSLRRTERAQSQGAFSQSAGRGA